MKIEISIPPENLKKKTFGFLTFSGGYGNGTLKWINVTEIAVHRVCKQYLLLRTKNEKFRKTHQKQLKWRSLLIPATLVKMVSIDGVFLGISRDILV